MLKFKENVLSTTIVKKQILGGTITFTQKFKNSYLESENIQYDIGSCCCCTCCCCIGVNVGSGSVATNFTPGNAE